MGTLNTVVVDDPACLGAATEIVVRQFQEVDRVCSRFRPDSELSRLNRRAGEVVPVSPLLEEAIVASLRAAEMTGGLVDPTLGRCVEEAGYSVTFRDMPADGPALELKVRLVSGWSALEHDPLAHTVRLPPGAMLDLGASGKAWAADRAAATVAGALGVAVAVDAGGDIAVAGPTPADGWPVRVGTDADSADGQDVTMFDGGLATSGTTARRWTRGGKELHHVIDPATGVPAVTPWSLVTVAAATCVEANAAATAAMIMGDSAVQWLDQLALPARLVSRAGAITYAGGWRG